MLNKAEIEQKLDELIMEQKNEERASAFNKLYLARASFEIFFSLAKALIKKTS